ncbi:MAG: hypothetical protein EPN57_04535 [Paraburkholderia sp.]|nr:MAG: hypothetical protein EPN57_04535 [Paraburkholderia sp.]
MNLIPVTFELTGVADSFRAEIKIETSGAEWTLSGLGGDADLGFSCNETISSEARAVSIQTVEVTKTRVSIVTGYGVSATPITLTTVLLAPPGLESIEGTCTLNAGARVYVRFGSGPVIEWEPGRNTGYLPGAMSNLQFIRLAIGGWAPGRSVSIELAGSEKESFQWAMGQGAKGTAPFSISAANGSAVQVGSIAFLPKKILLCSCGGAGNIANEINDLIIEAYIERIDLAKDSGRAPTGRIGLSASCDADIAVIVQIPGQYPQRLTSEPRMFHLM